MGEVINENYCPALNRALERWAAGDRARDWPKDDLDEALRIHRNRWQEYQVRQMLAFYAFDTGQKDAARAHMGYACKIIKTHWSASEPFLVEFLLQWVFLCARSGQPHPQTDELLDYAQGHTGNVPDVPFLVAKAKAAQALFYGSPEALGHIEAAIGWLKKQPDADKANMLAELEWLEEMRTEFDERRLGAKSSETKDPNSLSEYCPAADRVFAQWTSGQRPRDWSLSDLEEALQIHRHQWQEVWVREMMGYRALDFGDLQDAQAHLAYACSIGRDHWNLSYIPFLKLHMEWIFIRARMGRPHEKAEEWIEFARSHAEEDPGIGYLISRAEAAEAVFKGDPKALDHIEAAARWMRAQPNAEQDLRQAELFWLQELRNEYFERELG